MSKHQKWSTGETKAVSEREMYGVLFTARNKDNEGLADFKPRRKSFVTTKSVRELKSEFEHFVSEGVTGEMSRFYYSVNARSQERTQKALLHLLLDEQVNMAALSTVVTSVAMKKEQAKTKRWMFDFDGNAEQLGEFLEDLNKAVEKTGTMQQKNFEVEVEVYTTPNGFAVVVSRGFMTEELLQKWSKDETGQELVSLKRDDFLCVSWNTKTQ